MARTSLPVAGFATLSYVVSQFHIGYLLYQLRPNILVLQLSFHPARYWAVLSQWGEAGLRNYRAHLPWDFAHLFIYAAFGYVLATRAGLFDEPASRAARRTAWLLPLAALFDLVENLLQVHLLGGPFGAQSLAIPVSAGCSAVKWALAAGFALIVAWRVLRKSARIGLLSQ
ncbi:MAG: hypothetical protein L6Q69_15405 [Zoogloea sp.]|nr:hypothetical protein [Zoogloea sp.]